MLVTLLLEANGDQVVQMAMLDHFPTTVLPVIYDFEKLDATDPDCRGLFLERGFEVVDTQLRQEDGGLFPNQREYADQIRAVSQGASTSPATKIRWDRMKRTLEQMLDFIVSLSDLPPAALTLDQAMESLLKWMRVVKAPVSVYVAKEGMVNCLPEKLREEWREDLGTRRCYPDAEIVSVKGGHFEILADEGLIETLQKGFT